ncbi:MAG: hypothetical protein WCA95_15815 [Opitutaceae bacterium]
MGGPRVDHRVKLLGILALALVAMGAGNALSGDVPAADWRLQAFDEANGYLAKMQENEQAFLVGKEPRLADFYRNVMVPWQNAMQRLRRVIFIRKLSGKPELLKMSESPWTWALATPSSPEKIEIWLRDDKDGEVRRAYDEMKRTLEALGPANGSMVLRNEVAEQFKSDIYAIERVAVADLNSLEDRVRKHLEASN